MAEETPAHRTTFASRSGDTIIVGADGEARNIDQEARDAARAAKAAAQPRNDGSKKRAAQASPSPSHAS